MKNGSKTRTGTVARGHTIGLDLSDKTGTFVELDTDGRLVREGKVPLTETGLRKSFGGGEPVRIALEVGTHSPWVSRLLAGLGHEVIVANPRQVALISRNPRKTDRVDAESLARLARVGPTLLRPIQHRGEQAQADLAIIRARDSLVKARTELVNHVRGAVKAMGTRLPSCSPETFHYKVRLLLPALLRPALLPLLVQSARLTLQIRRYDRTLAELVRERYPETARLRQVQGVGPLTSAAFILTVEDPSRFRHSRAVGPYLGLVPRQDQSGEQRPELGLSKAGDPHLRRLLVQCAHYILGPFGQDCDLRRWGLGLAGSGSSQRKKKAIAAVARKLAVLLHHLWVTDVVYDPLYDATRRGTASEAGTDPAETETLALAATG
jgi:transposase